VLGAQAVEHLRPAGGAPGATEIPAKGDPTAAGAGRTVAVDQTGMMRSMRVGRLGVAEASR
jgi:hypothetical protein